jgi:hypothetical protein
MPIYEADLCEMGLPEPDDGFDEEWFDDDDDEYGYWDLICSILASLETGSLDDRVQTIELARAAINEWLDILYDEADILLDGDDFDFEYAEIAADETEIEIVPAPAAFPRAAEEERATQPEARPAKDREVEPGMREQSR